MRHLFFVSAFTGIAVIASAQAQSRHSNSRPTTVSLPDVIERVKASVVKITATYQYRVTQTPSVTLSAQFSGSGVIMDEKGHIATAAHLVNKAFITEQLKEENFKEARRR
ncbi:MAG: hypothetical protein ACR2IV_01630 [Bryobacteraceae bacterium]